MNTYKTFNDFTELKSFANEKNILLSDIKILHIDTKQFTTVPEPTEPTNTETTSVILLIHTLICGIY